MTSKTTTIPTDPTSIAWPSLPGVTIRSIEIPSTNPIHQSTQHPQLLHPIPTTPTTPCHPYPPQNTVPRPPTKPRSTLGVQGGVVKKRRGKGGRRAANPHLTPEQRRMERVLKNRESAMKSLQKKKMYTMRLEESARRLQERNEELKNLIRETVGRIKELGGFDEEVLEIGNVLGDVEGLGDFGFGVGAGVGAGVGEELVLEHEDGDGDGDGDGGLEEGDGEGDDLKWILSMAGELVDGKAVEV